MSQSFSIEIDGANFAGIEAGEGLPVVFLHAGVTDKRLWTKQVEAVAAAGYRAVAYDRRGFGETTAPDEAFNHLDDLEDLLEALGIQAAIIVGCSMGGGLAIDFALDAPERVVGLVLVGTSVTGAPEAAMPEEVMPVIDMLQESYDRQDWDTANKIHAHLWLDGPLSLSGRVSGPARELFSAMNGTVLNKPALNGEELPPAAWGSLEEITAPVLLLVGDLDFPDIVLRHDELSEELPNAFAAVIEGTAHLPSLERPDLFNPLLLQFLEAVTGTESGSDDDSDL